MRKVYLFACIEKNIGDDLFVYSICKRYPSCKFIISKAAKYGSLQKIPNLRFSRILQLWQYFSEKIFKNPILEIIRGVILYLLKFFLLDRAIGVYIVGNAFKNNNYIGIKQSRWIHERADLVNDFFLLSTNFGPYTDERWLVDNKRIFRSFADICFRDLYSYKKFCDLDNVRYAPDAVISLGKYIKKEENKDEYAIITLIDCAMSSRGRLINLSCKNYETALTNAAIDFIKKNIKVVILTSNNQQDYVAARRLYKNINNDRMVRIEEYNGDFYSVLELFSRARAVIATRLHTIILSWLYDVPVFPISYDIKISNLLRDYKFLGKYWDMLTQESYEINVEELLTEYEYVLPNEIEDAADEQFLVLDRYLSRMN